MDLSDPQYFINRELSWLEFNQRVLDQANDPEVPLLERLKFLCIVSSNLDEFFEVRVAGLKQVLQAGSEMTGPDGLTAAQQLAAISKRVRRLVADQYICWREAIKPQLAEKGVRFHRYPDVDEAERRHFEEYFEREVFPVLTPLALDPAHPFPQLLNKSLNILVELEASDLGTDLLRHRPT
jgi:polyphosphate kinase